MPAFFAWAVYIGEVIAPLLLIFGFYTRLGGLLITLNMLVAIVLAHASHVFQLTGSGGLRLELQCLFLFGSLAVALLGAGRYSIIGKGGKIGRASCRERVCQYVKIWVVAGSLKKKK